MTGSGTTAERGPAGGGALFALVKDVATYGIGDLLLKAASFFTLPVYTRLFAAEEFGKLSYVVSAAAFVTSLIALGGDSALARYYFEARSDDERSEITSTWLIFLLGWTAAVTLLLLPASGLLSRYSFGTAGDRWLFVLALLGMPVSLLSSLLGQVLRNQFRAQLFTVLNAATTLLTIALSLLFAVTLKLGVAGILGGTLAAGILLLPVRVWTARAFLRPTFSAVWLRKLLAYGLPLVPTSLAYWVFGTSDRILIGKLSTFEEVGYYSVASSLTSVLGLAYSALGQAWSPHAIMLYEADQESARRTYGQVLTYILAVFGLLAVGMTAFAHEAIVLLATDRYAPAALAIGPLALGFMAYASTQITAGGISLAKRTHYLAMYAWIAALLNIALNLPLVPRWGMVAASWATTVSYVFLTIAYALTSHRLWPIVYEARKVFAIVGGASMLVLLVPLVDAMHLDLVVALGAKALLCLAFVALLFAIGVLDVAWGRVIFNRPVRPPLSVPPEG